MAIGCGFSRGAAMTGPIACRASPIIARMNRVSYRLDIAKRRVPVRRWFAIGGVLAAIGAAAAQSSDEGPAIRLAQSSQAPISQPIPSTSPTSPSSAQSQAFTSCVMNCDTRVGLCQGTCSISNVPSVTTLGAPVSGGLTPAPLVRPDSGALSQCYLNCTAQQLYCKQACNIR